MQTVADMIDLAELCARNAHAANSRDVALTLWKMANEYAERVAKVDDGRMPDIGNPPSLVNSGARRLWGPVSQPW